MQRMFKMLVRTSAFAVLAGSFIPFGHAQTKTVAERLGYPRDAKLLIIHGDDLAVAHSVNRASFAALDRKAISSASIMVPCPWLTEVAAYAKEHPDADLGLHLTLTSEWKTYRWGPTAPVDQVPSLLDPEGYLWADEGLVARHVTPEDAEREIRAQIERALKAGIKPTHLDNHMGSLFGTPALFAVYVKVARDYGFPFLALRLPNAPPQMLSLLRDQDIVLDSVVTANEGIKAEGWKEYYVRVLSNVKPGLTELIVHLGYDDAELEAVTVDHPGWGAAWRQRDFDEMTSPEFKKLLEENHITVIGWKDLQKLLR
jgi:predicted glycoside hydrolase/deacetylase ChbG (UPF0249 family)